VTSGATQKATIGTLVPIGGRYRRLAWKAVAQPHLPMAVLAQALTDCGCGLALPPETSNVACGSLRSAICSPGPNVRPFPESSHTQTASLESCCSHLSIDVTACTRLRVPGSALAFSLQTSDTVSRFHPGATAAATQATANISGYTLPRRG